MPGSHGFGDQVVADPRAGQVRQPFAVCFHARPLSGSLAVAGPDQRPEARGS